MAVPPTLNPAIPATTPLRLAEVPARRGILWVRHGFQVFLRKPLAFTALLAALLVATMLLSLLPGIGVVLLLGYLPLLTLAFMLGTQAVLQGRTPTPALLVIAFRAEPRRRNLLLQLGGLYALSTLLVIVIAGWADGGAMDALEDVMVQSGTPEQVAAALGDPRLQFGLLIRFGLTALLSIPFWHAPALIWWGGQGLAQSLFSSTLACWRSRGAYAVYALMWMAVFIVFSTLLTLVFVLIGSREMLGVAAIPAGLMFSTAFYVSLYFSFADCFAVSTPAVPTEPVSP